MSRGVDVTGPFPAFLPAVISFTRYRKPGGYTVPIFVFSAISYEPMLHYDMI
jgi:hypothetical protein